MIPFRINVSKAPLSCKRKAASQVAWRRKKAALDKAGDKTHIDGDDTDGDDTDGDNLVGRIVLIERFGKRGKKFGHCRAVVTKRVAEKYECHYEQWPELKEDVTKAEMFDNTTRVMLLPV